MKLAKHLALVALLLGALGLTACDSDDGDSGATTGSISGVVTDLDTGDPIAGAEVATDPATTTATTAEDGTYTLADVPAGTYTVIVTADGYATKERAGLELAEGGSLTVDFPMAAEGETGNIAGTVTDEATGEPIEGATVVTDPATETVTSAADGTFEIAGVAAGTYTVTISAEGYADATLADLEVVAGETATADAALAAPAAVGSAVLTVVNLCNDAVVEGATIEAEALEAVTTDAEGVATMADLAAGEYAFTVDAAGFLPATVTVTIVAGEEATADVEMQCQTGAVLQAAADLLAMVTDETLAPFVSAQALFDNMNDGDDSNDPMVVSVRSGEHFALGHIPGAVNIPWKTVADEGALDALGEPFGDMSYVAYCYTGHTGGIAAAIMGMLGYPTADLLAGIGAWTKDPDVRIYAPFDEDVDGHDFAVETTINEAPADYEPPVLDFDVTTQWEAVQAAAAAFLHSEDLKATYKAQDLFDILNDGDDSNDPFVLSVRSAEHYAIGHIPTAVNIPWTQIASLENLRKLPTDRKIVVYCYTGHSGAMVTGILGALGYDVSDLKFGIMSWTKDEAVRVKTPFTEDKMNDFELETGM